MMHSRGRAPRALPQIELRGHRPQSVAISGSARRPKPKHAIFKVGLDRRRIFPAPRRRSGSRRHDEGGSSLCSSGAIGGLFPVDRARGSGTRRAASRRGEAGCSPGVFASMSEDQTERLVARARLDPVQKQRWAPGTTCVRGPAAGANPRWPRSRPRGPRRRQGATETGSAPPSRRSRDPSSSAPRPSCRQ
jgi:hypothetical protein